jgi:hypothetical protein
MTADEALVPGLRRAGFVGLRPGTPRSGWRQRAPEPQPNETLPEPKPEDRGVLAASFRPLCTYSVRGTSSIAATPPPPRM